MIFPLLSALLSMTLVGGEPRQTVSVGADGPFLGNGTLAARKGWAIAGLGVLAGTRDVTAPEAVRPVAVSLDVAALGARRAAGQHRVDGAPLHLARQARRADQHGQEQAEQVDPGQRDVLDHLQRVLDRQPAEYAGDEDHADREEHHDQQHTVPDGLAERGPGDGADAGDHASSPRVAWTEPSALTRPVMRTNQVSSVSRSGISDST